MHKSLGERSYRDGSRARLRPDRANRLRWVFNFELKAIQAFSLEPYDHQNLTWSIECINRRYFQHAHFIPIVGVGKRGAY